MKKTRGEKVWKKVRADLAVPENGCKNSQCFFSRVLPMTRVM